MIATDIPLKNFDLVGYTIFIIIEVYSIKNAWHYWVSGWYCLS